MGGWPFLIARGRRQGYRVLLAPDFLLSHGFLDDEVTSVPPGVRYKSAHVGGYFLVWNDYPVTEGEVQGPVRDEHSRPLVLTVGVLYPGDTTADDHELPRARQAALDTYRRFLADEDAFRVERSAQFDAPVRTAPQRPRAAAAVPAPADRPTAHPEDLAYAASRPLPPPPSPSGARLLVAGAAGVAVVAAIAVVLAVTGSEPEPPLLPKCPPVTTTTPSPMTSTPSLATSTPSRPPAAQPLPAPTPTPTPEQAPTPVPTPACVP